MMEVTDHELWMSLFSVSMHVYLETRHTHSVNASCSYVVHEDIICIHIQMAH